MMLIFVGRLDRVLTSPTAVCTSYFDDFLEEYHNSHPEVPKTVYMYIFLVIFLSLIDIYGAQEKPHE